MEFGSNRATDWQHADLRTRWESGVGTGRGNRGVVHSWGGVGAWVCESAWDDGGAFRGGSVWKGGDADVPDRGSGEMAGGWEFGIFRASGSAGEDPRVPGRVGGNRSSAGAGRGSGASAGCDAGGGNGGEAAGGICRSG